MAAGVAALLAAGAGALPPLPCATAGQSYLSCPAEWKFVGPATYVNAPDKLRAEGLAPLRTFGDDDDADDFSLEDSVPHPGPAARRGRTQHRHHDRDDKDDRDDYDRGLDRDDFDDARDKAVRSFAGTADKGLASASATQLVVEGPPGVWFAGTVNGGVWRSKNISAALPHWENVLDGQPVRCSAIAAMAVSPHDRNRVLAGCGPSTSGELGRSQQVLITGDWGGVMESRDGGDTWAMLDAFPVNYYVTAFAFPSADSMLVSAYSHFYNESDGGVWRTTDGGRTFGRTLGRQVFNLLHDPKTDTVVASAANDDRRIVFRSPDHGRSWAEWSAGAAFGNGVLPYYSCLSISSGGVVFLGALAREASNLTQTSSAIWYRSISDTSGRWTKVGGQPINLDQDLMAKDRMAVLVDPKEPSILYVAGNAAAVVYRVRWAAGSWEKAWGSEASGTTPHGDCRNFAWDSARDALLLTSDGGVFARLQPRAPGGVWVSLGGDIAAMEIVSVGWDAALSRWIGGAQDNGVQLSPPEASGRQQAVSVLGGDGCIVHVDNQRSPSRLWASIYQLSGLGFYEGVGESAKALTLPLNKWFADTLPAASLAFPFFQSVYYLNAQDPTRLTLWARGLGGNASAFWDIHVPRGVSSADDIKPPKKLANTDGDVYTFVSGGWTDGKPDIDVLVGVNDSALIYRSSATGGRVRARRLPGRIAAPIEPVYPSGLGPQSHGSTAFLAVSPGDSRIVAVCGVASTESNTGAEAVWITRDAGETWMDVFGDLAEASCTVARARPQGLLFVDFPEFKASALLVGTGSGVFLSWTDRPGRWSRLGQCADLPLVMVTALTYEGYSDTLVAATYGRGVYVIHKARSALAAARSQQMSGRCSAPASPLLTPSDYFLPPRQA
eukprot:TRINITY_DN570_c1_g2_i1.p1 TRINITY_DN570_c1_g2~~TRINITY_DN570_c1_g2_i1.p1  ORF type:complete len:921 (+),score=206.82 TRINITY_DN570_c1_g2_i1:84-2765(+)